MFRDGFKTALETGKLQLRFKDSPEADELIRKHSPANGGRILLAAGQFILFRMDIGGGELFFEILLA